MSNDHDDTNDNNDLHDNNSHDENDRRRFFRIVDTLGIAYNVLTEDEVTEDKNIDDYDNWPQFLDTFSVMKKYNDVFCTSLENIQVRDPEIATAIKQLNKKIDALLMMLELDSLMAQHMYHKTEEASISASGIAFPLSEPVAKDAFLAMSLLLQPSPKHIHAIGRVVSCDQIADEPLYYVRVEFTKLSNNDTETLIQHIVQRQGTLLRVLNDDTTEQPSVVENKNSENEP